MRLGRKKHEPEEGKASAQLSDIDQAALKWFVANHGEEADGAAFADWYAADDRHADAYERIESLWGSTSFAGAVKRARPRRGRVGGAVAAMAICLMVGSLSLKLTGGTLAWPADHSTAVGQLASTTLEDGSQVILDSGSAIDVSFTDTQREIKLLRGRVYVSVSPDERPLLMRSGDAIIRDIGTSFTVSRDKGAEYVAVADGIVDLSTSSEGSGQRINAGQASALVDGKVAAVRTINQLETFGWTKGRLYFSNKPVGQIVDELKRYHRGWIIIANKEAAKLPISGGLDLNDPTAAMEELARLSGSKLAYVSDHILILR